MHDTKLFTHTPTAKLCEAAESRVPSCLCTHCKQCAVQLSFQALGTPYLAHNVSVKPVHYLLWRQVCVDVIILHATAACLHLVMRPFMSRFGLLHAFVHAKQVYAVHDLV